jgi:hypothetical protein
MFSFDSAFVFERGRRICLVDFLVSRSIEKFVSFSIDAKSGVPGGIIFVTSA